MKRTRIKHTQARLWSRLWSRFSQGWAGIKGAHPIEKTYGHVFFRAHERELNVPHGHLSKPTITGGETWSFLCTAIGAFVYFDDPTDPQTSARYALKEQR